MIWFLTFVALQLLKKFGEIKALCQAMLSNVLSLLLPISLVIDEPSLLGIGHLQLTLLIYLALMCDILTCGVGQGRPHDVHELLHYVFVVF